MFWTEPEPKGNVGNFSFSYFVHTHIQEAIQYNKNRSKLQINIQATSFQKLRRINLLRGKKLLL